MDFITDVTDVASHECAYDQCQCQIPAAEEYCSDYCAGAGDIGDITDVEGVETQCGCEHSACEVS
jgi:hypothetical protein